MVKKIFPFVLSFLLLSCAELQNFVEQYDLEQSRPLTSNEVTRGLKEALRVGSVNASNILSAENGFYKDELVKILLPPEAQIISRNIQLVPGGKELVNKVEIRLNRAAEDAVKQAAPIFALAIREMTIADAFDILKGDSNAATSYLKKKTFNKLYDLFLPKVNTSLDKKLVANLSTNESWNLLTTNYNTVANSVTGKLANLEPVHTVTNKALDALFLKVAKEEELIRKDPLKRVNEILKRVFGSQNAS